MSKLTDLPGMGNKWGGYVSVEEAKAIFGENFEAVNKEMDRDTAIYNMMKRIDKEIEIYNILKKFDKEIEIYNRVKKIKGLFDCN